MKRVFIFLFVFALCNANAQTKILPPEARAFMPKGYELLDYVAGDLNGDKRSDAILVAKIIGEDTAITDEIVRPFIILIRQGNGKLKQEKRNDNLVICRQCGGVFGDPYDNTTVTTNGFSIEFYGGSSWRWGYTYRFAWKPSKNNWYLVSEKEISFQSGDPEKTMKKTLIEEAELGEVSFDDYGKYSGADHGKWRVTAAKTFFFDKPKVGAKPRKAYLLKGDNVTVVRLLTNFAYVSFENSKGTFTSGYVLKKDLEKIK